MINRSQIIAARAVREMLDAEDLETLARQAATGYKCVTCGEPGELGVGRATVVVRLMTADAGGVPGPMAHVRLAHERCSPSAIVPHPDVFAVPTESGMQATAVVLPEGMRRRALLIVEPSSSVVAVTDGGERLGMFTSVLLSQGLSLISSPWQRAPSASGWQVRLPSPVEAVVCDPDGEEIYTGELDQPHPWRKVVRRGYVELLFGDIGLAATGPGNPAAGVQALEDAARDGRLVGGTVRVTV